MAAKVDTYQVRPMTRSGDGYKEIECIYVDLRERDGRISLEAVFRRYPSADRIVATSVSSGEVYSIDATRTHVV
jgi:hypothetical protein